MAEKEFGLDGTIVAQTRLGLIDGDAGRLSVSGYDIHALAEGARWEEVAYLLWHGELPSAAQLAAMHAQLAAARALSEAELALLRRLPREGHAMDAARMIVAAMAELHAPGLMREASILDQGLLLSAKLPTLLASWHRLRVGVEPVAPDPALGHAANFLLTLHGRPPSPAEEAALNTYMVLLAEHGLNVSSFVARVVASTQTDLHAALCAALAALKGQAHGGANEHAMRTFLAIGAPERAPEAIEGLLARKERLMGVGHRIYRVEDPRVRHLRAHSAALAARPGADASGHAVAEAVAAYIIEHPHFQARKLHPNVEFYSAPLLHALGFPLDMFTLAFACARTPGWVAHIREQLAVARLVRPEAAYIGPPMRAFVPLERRVI
jgi:citrate synthase